MRILALSGATFIASALALPGQAPIGAPLAKLTEIQLTDKLAARPGGGGPEAIASDGTYIWVADQFGNSVTRLDGLTGLRLGTFAVGNRPVALLAVKSTLWVANLESDTLTQFSTLSLFACEHRHCAEMLALTRFIYAC